MTYLSYVAIFGAGVVVFLWLRDAHIFARTALPGYRKAAYYGVLYTALALFGVAFAVFGNEFIGLGIILLSLYLQGRTERERVFTGESTIDRLLGNARRRKDKGPK